MKPARFILNSDYTTLRNTGHGEVSVVIPNTITIPSSVSVGDSYLIGRSSVKVGSPSDSFSVVFSTSYYDYDSIGLWGMTRRNDATSSAGDYPLVVFYISVNGDEFILQAYVTKTATGTQTLSNYGLTLTAHIYTFKDPFTE